MAKSTSSDRQEAPKNAATSRYRLPDTALPVAYRLTIEPDLERLTYNGVVEIDLMVGAPTAMILAGSLAAIFILLAAGGVLGSLFMPSAAERARLRNMQLGAWTAAS